MEHSTSKVIVSLCAWLFCAISMSCFVWQSTSGPARPLPDFVTGKSAPTPEPVVTPPPAPQPAPAAEPAPAPAPVSEWVEVEKGKTAGKGRLSPFTLHAGQDGAVVVTIPIDGTPGQQNSFVPAHNPKARSVDLMGVWKGSAGPFQTTVKNGVIGRLQVAVHQGYLRLSGIGSKAGAAPSARVEYSEKASAFRVTFFRDEDAVSQVRRPLSPAPAKPAAEAGTGAGQ